MMETAIIKWYVVDTFFEYLTTVSNAPAKKGGLAEGDGKRKVFTVKRMCPSQDHESF